MLSFRSLLLLSLTILLAACAPTKQARSVETTGFLGTLYPLMHEGSDGEALLVYRNPKLATIPRGTYKKIWLDHVEVWGPPTENADKQKDAQHAADLLYSLVYQSLSKDYEMVTAPEPGTLHVQAAITKTDKAMVILRAVSTIPAPMNAFAVASLLKNVGTGKPLFVGEVSVEMKISDAQTGEILAATADDRVGKKRLDADSFDSWDDVHRALEYWAKLFRYRLCHQRGGNNCVAPQE